jgi:hypothetical protein
MELIDLIKKREGFIPTIRILRDFGKHPNENELKSFVKLRKRPVKLTMYVHKDKIAEIYKTTEMRADKEYYLIKAIDGTILQVNY